MGYSVVVRVLSAVYLEALISKIPNDMPLRVVTFTMFQHKIALPQECS